MFLFCDYSQVQRCGASYKYLNNPTGAGAPAVNRYENSINYFWGQVSPDPAIAPDNFSARWTGTFPFQGATYRFTLAGDDGLRLVLDNVPAIDRMDLHALKDHSHDFPLAAGTPNLRIL